MDTVFTQQLTIGLTGGIGSGKTMASDWFATQGIPIIDADVLAREVVTIGSEGLAEIVAHWGESILLDDGNLNRALLRQLIFNDEAAKKTLEAITHPKIHDKIKNALNTPKETYQILVSPLLLEGNQRLFVDRVLLIDVDESTQKQRASKRDNQSEAAIERIIKMQMPRDLKQKYADDIISNHSTPEALYQLLRPLHQQYQLMHEQLTQS